MGVYLMFAEKRNRVERLARPNLSDVDHIIAYAI
jgi:hypothetical protein